MADDYGKDLIRAAGEAIAAAPMTPAQPASDLVERPWYQQDPLTGNFAAAKPPQQFTVQQLEDMLRQRVDDATEITALQERVRVLREFLSEIGHDLRLWPDGHDRENEARYVIKTRIAALNAQPNDSRDTQADEGGER